MPNKKLNILYFEADSNDFSKINALEEDSAPIIQFRDLNGVVINRVLLFKLVYPKVITSHVRYVKENPSYIVVDDSVFFENRNVLIKKILKIVVEGRMNLDYTRKVVRLMLDDSYSKIVDFENVESCREFYKYQTDLLFSRMRLSKVRGNHIKRKTASTYQSSMVVLFSNLFDLQRSEVERWYFNITAKKGLDRPSEIKVSGHDFKVSYALHRRVFEGIFEFIFCTENKPLYIKSSDIVESDLLYITSVYNTWRDGVRDVWGLRNLTYDKDRFYSYEEAISKAKENGLELSREERIAIKRYCKSNLVTSLEYRKKKLANYAVFAFISILVAETGANAGGVLNLDISTGVLEKEIGQYRVLTVKARSNYQRQSIRMPSSFLSVWRKYLKLREWMIENSKTKDHELPFAIYYPLGISNDNDVKPIRPEYLSAKISYLVPHGFYVIPLSQWRKRKSQSLTNNSEGDLSISSAVLNQSISTVQKHYTSSKFETAAVEFHSFFEELNKYSKLIVSNSLNVPPVIEDGLSIKSGRCKGNNSEDANKIDYLDKRVPDPDCKKSLHCVFCSKFGIHINVVDLKKLLSMKVWVSYQIKSGLGGIEESLLKYGGIIQRIDSILQGLLEHYPSAKSVYDIAIDDIENGRFDDFWGAKIAAYIEAGI
jgi:hypothetical protein